MQTLSYEPLLLCKQYFYSLFESGGFAYIAREDDIRCLRECALLACLPYRDPRTYLSKNIGPPDRKSLGAYIA